MSVHGTIARPSNRIQALAPLDRRRRTPDCLVADTAALAALFIVPLPVISVMGGVNPENQDIAVTARLVAFFGLLSLPVWSVLAGSAAYSRRDVPEWTAPPMAEPPAGNREVVALTVLACVFWAALLPFTQPAQNLAWRVEHAYRGSGPAAARSRALFQLMNDPTSQPPGNRRRRDSRPNRRQPNTSTSSRSWPINRKRSGSVPSM